MNHDERCGVTGMKVLAILNIGLATFIIVFGTFMFGFGGGLVALAVNKTGNSSMDKNYSHVAVGFIVMFGALMFTFLGLLNFLLGTLMLVGTKQDKLVETVGRSARGPDTGQNVFGRILLQFYLSDVKLLGRTQEGQNGSLQANIKSGA